MTKEAPIRIAVIGAGSWATNYHFPTLKHLSGEGSITLRGIWNRTESKARKAAENLGIPRVYGSPADLTEDPEVDAYVVLVNPKALPDIVSHLVKKDLPIFTEKSPGWTAEEARSLAATVSVTNVVGFNRRYMPLNRRFKEIVDGMDDPFYSECHFYRHDRRCDEFIVETGVHGINYLEYLLGPFAAIETDRRRDRSTGTYSWECRMSFSSGIRGYAKFFPCSGSSIERYEVHSRALSAYLESPQTYSSDYPGRIIIHEKGREKEVIEAKSGGDETYHAGFIDEYRDFITAVRTGSPTISNFANARTTMEIAGIVERGADFPADVESSEVDRS